MKKIVKVLYILPSLEQGGAERFTLDLLVNLDREKFSSRLLLFKRGGAWINEAKQEGVPVAVLNKKRGFDLVNFYQIYKFIRDWKPDIVHTQLGGDIYGRLAAYLAGVKTIVSTEQNVNADEPWYINILKRLASRCGKTVAITKAVRDDAAKRYGLKNEDIALIPNGVNVDKYNGNFKKITRQDNQFICGTIGRLSKQKGHSFLIEALANTKDSVKCLIAGTGSLENVLKQKIISLGLEKRVELVGQVDNVPDFLVGLDAFIFPSIWEGQGIVLLEAGLSGLPIIASRVGGIKEIIDDETAWLVPPGDSRALTEKIIWLSENINSPLVKEKTDRFAKRIVERYSIKKSARKYEDLYINLLR